MGFVEDVGRSFSDLSKTGELRNLISAEKKNINNLYMEIGTLYYEQNKNSASPMYAFQVNKIREALARIEGYNNQIAMMNSAVPAQKRCPNCGNFVAVNNTFCAVCGSRVDAPPSGKVCKNCGKVSTDNGMFCAGCGARLEEEKPENNRICTRCGGPVTDGDAFCMNCGAKVEKTEPQEPVAEEVAAAPVAPVVDESATPISDAPTVETTTFEAPVAEVTEEPAPLKEESVWTPEAVEAEEAPVEEAGAVEPAPEVVAEPAPPEEECVWTPEAVEEEEAPVEEAGAVEPAPEAVEEPAPLKEEITWTSEALEEEDVPVAEAIAEVETVTVDTANEEPEAEFENPYAEMVQDNICKVCGKEVSPNAKFCIFCGTKR